MKTGRVWAGTIGDIPVQVVYTRHFGDRFERDEGDRPAVSMYVDEPEILEVILDALPGITDTWRSSWDHSGVITSKGRDLNMSYLTETDQDGMKVVMKNMMLKHAYQPHSEDYVFSVAGMEMGDGSSQGGSVDGVWKVFISIPKFGFISRDVLMSREEARALSGRLQGWLEEGKVRDFEIKSHYLEPFTHEDFLKMIDRDFGLS